jgi:Heavy metal binding domain
MVRPESQRQQGSRLLLLLCLMLWPSVARAQQTVAQSAARIDEELIVMPSMSAQSDKLQLCARVARHVARLKEQSIMVFGDRRAQLDERLRELIRSCDDWQSGTPDEARAAAERAQELWAAIKSLYPREALQPLPRLWSCPMHQELMETAAGPCPICGMPLAPIYVTQPQLTEGPIIGAEVIADDPLEVGRRADLRIRLFFLDNSQPVRLSDLQEAHTRRIHLLISDISETDYHHEHPEPVGDGEYAFGFTPRRPDTYRVWADLLPLRTEVQQYSVADIPSSTPRRARLDEKEAENRHSEIDGYGFDLSFEKDVLLERETVAGKLRVTEPDGQPCTRLGVVMGAFGHFVGFGDDFATVLHLHPTGPVAADAESRSGPELPFYFRSEKAGRVRLFAQVRIAGKDYFPRFVIDVRFRNPADGRPGEPSRLVSTPGPRRMSSREAGTSIRPGGEGDPDAMGRRAEHSGLLVRRGGLPPVPGPQRRALREAEGGAPREPPPGALRNAMRGDEPRCPQGPPWTAP